MAGTQDVGVVCAVALPGLGIFFDRADAAKTYVVL
jgi:hypothetical protein